MNRQTRMLSPSFDTRAAWVRGEDVPIGTLSDHLPTVATYFNRLFVTWNVANPVWDKWLANGPLKPITKNSPEDRKQRIVGIIKLAMQRGAYVMLQEVHPDLRDCIRENLLDGYQLFSTSNFDPKDTEKDCGVMLVPEANGVLTSLPNCIVGSKARNYIMSLDLGYFTLVNTHNKFRLESEEFPLQLAHQFVIDHVGDLLSKGPVIIGGDWNADLATVRAQMASIEFITRSDVYYTGSFAPTHFNSNDRALSIYDHILMIDGGEQPIRKFPRIEEAFSLEQELRALTMASRRS